MICCVNILRCFRIEYNINQEWTNIIGCIFGEIIFLFWYRCFYSHTLRGLVVSSMRDFSHMVLNWWAKSYNTCKPVIMDGVLDQVYWERKAHRQEDENCNKKNTRIFAAGIFLSHIITKRGRDSQNNFLFSSHL